MKQLNLKSLSIAILLLATLAVTTACNGKKNFTYEPFKTTADGLIVCNKFFQYCKEMPEDANMEDLANTTLVWISLQKEMYTLFYNDSINDATNQCYNDFSIVADSIRHRLQGRVNDGNRSLGEIVYYTTHTVKDLSEDEDYKYWTAFYGNLDMVSRLKTRKAMIDAYATLLDEYTNVHFKDENAIEQFLVKEDRCFRSLMPFFDSLTDNETTYIINETEVILGDIYKVVDAMPEEKKAKMIMGLTMRFNRRLLQNAAQCANEIESGKRLSAEGAANYRWTLLQPFVELEEYPLSLLTPAQKKQLVDDAEKLEERINATYENAEDRQAGKTIKAVGEYILLLHLNNIL